MGISFNKDFLIPPKQERHYKTKLQVVTFPNTRVSTIAAIIGFMHEYSNKKYAGFVYSAPEYCI